MTNEELESAVRKAKRDYMREWRAKNPEKSKQNNRNFWIRKALQGKEKQEGENNAEIISEE